MPVLSLILFIPNPVFKDHLTIGTTIKAMAFIKTAQQQSNRAINKVIKYVLQSNKKIFQILITYPHWSSLQLILSLLVWTCLVLALSRSLWNLFPYLFKIFDWLNFVFSIALITLLLFTAVFDIQMSLYLQIELMYSSIFSNRFICLHHQAHQFINHSHLTLL